MGIEFPRTGVTEVVSTMELLRTKPGSSVRRPVLFALLLSLMLQCPIALICCERGMPNLFSASCFLFDALLKRLLLLFTLNLLFYVLAVLGMKCSMNQGLYKSLWQLFSSLRTSRDIRMGVQCLTAALSTLAFPDALRMGKPLW